MIFDMYYRPSLLGYGCSPAKASLWGPYQRAPGCHEEPCERQTMTFHLLERPQGFKGVSSGVLKLLVNIKSLDLVG